MNDYRGLLSQENVWARLTPQEKAIAVPLAERFLTETMTDPDMVGRSADYQAGYRAGVCEMIASMLPFLAHARREATPSAAPNPA